MKEDKPVISVNSDRRKKKRPTIYDDYYTPFVRNIVETIEGLEHLQRERKQWITPKPYETNVKYSVIDPVHIAAINRRKAKRRR